jgi:hypothetical protein
MELIIASNLFHLFLIWVLILISHALKFTDEKLSFLLIISSISPFIFNGFLFAPEYMPDQFRYLDSILTFRELSIPKESSFTVFYSSLILSLIPMPFVFDLIGVGFINKFIFISLLIYLSKNRIFPPQVMFFLAVYPDLLMYTSLSLRDTLVFILMTLSFIFLMKRLYVICFLSLLVLLVLKFQNFAFMLFLILGYIFLRNSDKELVLKRVLVFWSFLIILSFVITPLLLDEINFYRKAMFIEDGGQVSAYVDLVGVGDIFLKSSYAALNFFFSPFIWSAGNYFQLLQSLVNIAVFFVILFFTVKFYKLSPVVVIFWLSFIYFTFTIYGLVVANEGTISRYRFPFVALFVMGISYGRANENNRERCNT